jgi:hypothetical protein
MCLFLTWWILAMLAGLSVCELSHASHLDLLPQVASAGIFSVVNLERALHISHGKDREIAGGAQLITKSGWVM